MEKKLELLRGILSDADDKLETALQVDEDMPLKSKAKIMSAKTDLAACIVGIDKLKDKIK